MDAVIVTTYKTRKAAEKYAAALAFMDDGTYWNGRETVSIPCLNFRAVQHDGSWLVVRDFGIADIGRKEITISL